MKSLFNHGSNKTLIENASCLMSLKREISLSLAAIENISKKVDIGDNKSEMSEFMEIGGSPTIRVPHHPLTTVMSTAESDFGSRYDIINEIGRELLCSYI